MKIKIGKRRTYIIITIHIFTAAIEFCYFKINAVVIQNAINFFKIIINLHKIIDIEY